MSPLTKTEARTEGAPVPLPFYSQGVTNQILRNISNILTVARTSLNNAVKANVFLTDMGDFDEMNKAYAEFFKEGVRPVRICVAVKELPFGADVEIEMSAYL